MNNNNTIISVNNMLFATGHNEYNQFGTGVNLNLNNFKRLGVPNFKQVDSGWGHTVVLLNDGTLMVAGKNQNGQLGTGDTVNKNKFIELDINNIKRSIFILLFIFQTIK